MKVTRRDAGGPATLMKEHQVLRMRLEGDAVMNQEGAT